MTQWVDREIPHLPVRGTGVPEGLHTLATSNWMPYQWSLNNVVMAEALHAALGFWQAGRPEEAWHIAKDRCLPPCSWASRPATSAPLSFLDVYRRESQRDFGDGAGGDVAGRRRRPLRREARRPGGRVEDFPRIPLALGPRRPSPSRRLLHVPPEREDEGALAAANAGARRDRGPEQGARGVEADAGALGGEPAGERLVHLAGGLVALVDVAGHRLVEDGGEGRVEVRHQRLHRRRGLEHDAEDQLVEGLGLEGDLAGDALVRMTPTA